MQQADVRIRFLDNLSVHFENQAQHAMCRGMLRPEVHCEILNLSHRLPDPSGRPNNGCRRE